MYSISERWSTIKDFPQYSISTNGRVRKGSILLKPRDNRRGYNEVALYREKYYHKKIHRLVAEAFIPNKNNLPEVHHKDNNRKNNYLFNLQWTTKSDNLKWRKYDNKK